MRTGVRGTGFLAALLVAALGALALAGVASAKDLYLYEFEKSFNGADSNVGPMSNKLLKVAVNNENGDLYVLDQHNGRADITQFNENGEAALWSALGGTNTIELPGTLSTTDDLIFDNESGEHWGLFVLGEFEDFGHGRAYKADGTVRIPSFIKAIGGTCGVGMSRDGGLYVGTGQFASRFNPANGAIIENGLEGSPWAEGAPCHNVWDLNNDSWLALNGEHECACEIKTGLQKYGGPDEIFFKFPNFAAPNIIVQPGDAGSPIKPVHGADIDESNDNLFTVEDGREVDGPAQVLQVTDRGQPLLNFGAGTIHQSTGIAVNSNNHKVYVTSQTPTPHIDIFKRNPTPITVPDATTLPAAHPDSTSATLRAEIDPAGGGTTTDCRFDWGPSTNYAFGSIPCNVGGTETNTISSPTEVTSGVASLTPGNQYHYRVATRNANGHWSFGADQLFEASIPPTTTPLLVEKINTDSGHFVATIDPHGGTTKWRLEIGTEDCSLGGCEVIKGAEGRLKSRTNPESVQVTAQKLAPGTLYHVRLVAENGAGTIEPSLEFRTYPAPPTEDRCENRTVRQQTGASQLLDCRAYELVSAANAGSYDVESDLVPLQTPFTAMPNAKDRVLYGLHYGSIPNIAGDPPNFGLDPYVAERTPSGWVTSYVGLPTEGMADDEAFGSPLLGSDEALSDFAFGGDGICDPCFAGEGTNIPVRLDHSPAAPGMAGAYSGASEPEGTVLKYMSGDGSHLLFGSEHAFAAGGMEGDAALYSRDLGSGTTELVSTDESGAALSGPGLAGIDQSADGSRVIVGEPVGNDGAGHPLYDLYLHRAGSGASTELTPDPVAGSRSGATYDGMTADGSMVFFTTVDRLLATDTDESADIYEAAVDSSGARSLRLISTKSDGQPSNDDGCTPPGSPTSWNAAVGDGRCGALAFAYGAGVASANGTFFFVTPEQLEAGQGEAGQANLYVVRPGGAPHFVATIDSSAAKAPRPAPRHPLANSGFATVAGTEALSVDGSNGDVYAVNGAEGKLTRLNSSGGADNFTSGPGSGTNVISGFSFETPAGNAVAVDNSSSGIDPFRGYFYVTSKSGEDAGVSVWKPSGEKAGQITGAGTSVGSFTSACGVAVDEADGSLYIGDKGGYIWRYRPTGSAPVTDADYAVTGIKTSTQAACAVAVQGPSVLAATFAEGAVKRYAKSSFAANPLNQGGTQVTGKGRALTVDASTGELLVDEGNGVVIFNEAGTQIGTIENEGAWNGSWGLAVNPSNHHLFVSAVAAGTIVEYGSEPAKYSPIDNPGIVDATTQPETHSYRDFQVTPDGHYAAFTTALALAPYSNNGHLEIYRYDSDGDSYECASCAPTLAPAKNDTTLSSYGLNLADNGKVFFTSRESLVLSDTNEKLDAYQWNGGLEVGIISTGRSSFDSKLLSASADGTDAFFFTRDVLVDSDENGGAVKIYDARANGGYLQSSAQLPCAASDECHGPGTPQPPAPDINSITGAGQQPAEGKLPKAKCKKGFVKKHKKCVKKHHGHHRKHRSGRNG